MKKAFFYESITKIIESDTPVDESTEFSSNDDFDSLAIFTVFVFLKNHGCPVDIVVFSQCKTVGDLASHIKFDEE